MGGRKARELTEGQSRVDCWLSAGRRRNKLDGAMVLGKQKPEELEERGACGQQMMSARWR